MGEFLDEVGIIRGKVRIWHGGKAKFLSRVIQGEPAGLVVDHIRDLGLVAREARRLARARAALVFVTADSSLRKAPLAVLDPSGGLACWSRGAAVRSL